MNLKDPLWNLKHIFDMNDSVSTITADTYAPRIFSNVSETLLTHEMDALIEAFQSSGTHMWSFKTYWIISLPVTVLTILFPIFAGRIFQFSVRNLIRYQGYVVPIWMVLYIALGLVLSTRHQTLAYRLIFHIPLFIGAALAVYFSSFYGKYQCLSVGFAMIFWVCFWIDIEILPGLDYKMPLSSGLGPPTYILITITLFQVKLDRHVELYMYKIFDIIDGKKGRKRREYLRIGLMILYYGIAFPYFWFVPDSGLISATIFFSVSINRMLRFGFQEDYGSLFAWLGFCVIVVCSLVVDNIYIKGDHLRGILTSYLPMSAIFGYWAFRNTIRGFLQKLE